MAFYCAIACYVMGGGVGNLTAASSSEWPSGGDSEDVSDATGGSRRTTSVGCGSEGPDSVTLRARKFVGSRFPTVRSWVEGPVGGVRRDHPGAYTSAYHAEDLPKYRPLLSTSFKLGHR